MWMVLRVCINSSHVHVVCLMHRAGIIYGTVESYRQSATSNRQSYQPESRGLYVKLGCRSPPVLVSFPSRVRSNCNMSERSSSGNLECSGRSDGAPKSNPAWPSPKFGAGSLPLAAVADTLLLVRRFKSSKTVGEDESFTSLPGTEFPPPPRILLDVLLPEVWRCCMRKPDGMPGHENPE